MDAADLGVARTLMAQLGYDITADDLAARFDAVTGDADHALLVAERGGLLVGLVHVFGRALMDRAEGWARARGLASVALHTTLPRADARAFYARLGYGEVAQSALLRKPLVAA